MFGSGGQAPQQPGGFGSGQARAFGSSGFGQGGAGAVKWGGGSKPQAPAQQAKQPGAALFGKAVQRPASAPNGGRGRGRFGTQSGQQGRGWQGSRTPPAGRGRGPLSSPPERQVQSQPHQQRSPGVLQRLGSLVGSPWSKGQQQQQPADNTPSRAAAAATAALAGGRNSSWGGRGRGRAAGPQHGRDQPPQQQQQQWGKKALDSRQQRQSVWMDRGRGRGRGRSQSRSSVFDRLGSKTDAAAGGEAGGEEEMTPADWGGEGDAADGVEEQQIDEGWEGHEEDMEDMDADQQYDDGYQEIGDAEKGGNGDWQQYDDEDEQAEDGDEQQSDDQPVMTAEEVEAAKQAALDSMPKFICHAKGGSNITISMSNPGAIAAVATPPAAASAGTPSRTSAAYLTVFGGGTPGSSITPYDQLQPSPSRPDVRARVAAAAQGGLHIDPQCIDMCPKAEREQRTADRQLHQFERVAGDYRTDAHHAVKKYTRSEAGGLPDPTLLRTFDALKKTLVHLRGLMARVGDGSSGTCTLLEAHRFLWDRYRSIRKDITQTELIHRGDNQLRWVIAANEEMARFMILADAFLADKDKINYDVKKTKTGATIEFDMDQFQADAEAAAAERAAAGVANFEPDPYDGHLNHQELSKTLLDLSALYREAHRVGVVCPNEAEFLSYYLIVSRGTFGSFKQSTANFVRLLNQMNPDVAGSPYIQFALQLSGCLASTNYVGFIKLLEVAPLHLAAVGQIYIPRMRSIGLCCMLQSAPPTSRRVKQLSLELYTQLLAFDTQQQAMQFVLKHKCPNLTISTDSNGDQLIEVPNASLSQLNVMKEPPRYCLSWILDKAAGVALGDLVSQPCQVPAGAAGNRLVARTAVRKQQIAPQRAGAAAPWQQGPRSAAITKPAKQPFPAPLPAAAGQPGKVLGAGAPQQQQPVAVQTSTATGQGFGSSATYARGSADHLPAMMAPAAASAGASAVFGRLGDKPVAGSAWGPAQQTPPKGAAVPAAVQQKAASVSQGPQGPLQPMQQQEVMQAQQQDQQRVLQQSAGMPGQMQQQTAALQQQQQQLLLHQQKQQQEAAAIAAAVAAERSRAAADARRAAAALAEKDAEIKRLKKSENELRLIKQERELRDKCEDVARRLWFAKWSTAAAAVKAARLLREREDAALAAVDVSLGRLRGNNKRSLAVADSSHGHGAAAGVTEWERQQEKRARANLDAYDAALADLTPAPAAQILAAALTEAAAVVAVGTSGQHPALTQQPALTLPQDVIYLPGLTNSSSSSNGSRSGMSYRAVSASAATACPPAPLHYRLLVVTGWGEEDQQLAPPLYQRRVANWVRHKLAQYLPARMTPSSAAAGSNGLAVNQQDVAAVLVPVGIDPSQQQQQPRTWASVVSGQPAVPIQQQQEAPRQVWRFGGSQGYSDLLVSKTVAVPGPVKQPHISLVVEVVDVVSSKLAQATAAADGHGRGGSPPMPNCVCGACGILLLVSGPDPAELSSAVGRLRILLEAAADRPAMPLVVFTCSGPSSQSSVESGLSSLISSLPDHLAAKLSGGKVVAGGPGADPDQALQEALTAAAAAAPQLPRLRQIAAAGLLQALLVLSLGPSAAADAADADADADSVLLRYITAHNQSIQRMTEVLQQQLASDVYRWGYPATATFSSGSHAQRITQLLPRLEGLLLPTPSPQQQQQHQSKFALGMFSDVASCGGVGGWVLLQVVDYLNSLARGQGPPAAAAHAGAVLALLQQQVTLVVSSRMSISNGDSSLQQAKHQHLSHQLFNLVCAAIGELLVLMHQELASVGSLLVAEDTVTWLANIWQQQQQEAQQQQLAALTLHQEDRAVVQQVAGSASSGDLADRAAQQLMYAQHQRQQDSRSDSLLTPHGMEVDVAFAARYSTPAAGLPAISNSTSHLGFNDMLTSQHAVPSTSYAAVGRAAAGQHSEQAIHKPLVSSAAPQQQVDAHLDVASVMAAANEQRQTAIGIAAALGIRLPGWLS